MPSPRRVYKSLLEVLWAESKTIVALLVRAWFPKLYLSCSMFYFSSRCRPIPWIIFSIILALVISISTAVIVRYSASPDYTATCDPTDTRIIPDLSSALCQGLQLTVTEATTSDTVSLYILDFHPSLSGSDVFGFPVDNQTLRLFLGAGEFYRYYGFYMYPESIIRAMVCVGMETPYSTGFFYLLKGRGAIHNWERAPYEYDPDFTIDKCGEDAYIFERKIVEEDYYYLVFSAKFERVALEIRMEFLRTRYELPANFTTDKKCSAVSGDSCTIGLPLSGETAFLMVTPPYTPVDYKHRLDLDVKCVPRTWMYFIIALATFVGLLIIMVPMVAPIDIIVKWRTARATGPGTSSLLPSAGDQTTYGST